MEQLNKIAGISNLPSNIHIYPQGKLTFLPNSYGNADSPNQILKKLNIHNKDEYKIIVASGYAQIRKGVDLFIYTAKYILRNTTTKDVLSEKEFTVSPFAVFSNSFLSSIFANKLTVKYWKPSIYSIIPENNSTVTLSSIDIKYNLSYDEFTLKY